MCAESLYLDLPVDVITKHCSFVCEPRHSKIIVRRERDYKYIVTNAQGPLKMEDTQNKDNSLEIFWNMQEIGAVQMHLPCNLELIQVKNSIKKTLIRKAFPCTTNSPINTEIRQIIPFQWSNKDSMSDNEFDNLEQVIDINWKNRVPLVEAINNTVQNYPTFINVNKNKNNNSMVMYSLITIIVGFIFCIIIILIWLKKEITYLRKITASPENNFDLNKYNPSPNTNDTTLQSGSETSVNKNESFYAQVHK